MTLIQSEGIYVCKKCGNTTNAIIDSDRPNYKEPPPDISHFSYKRINHFNESDVKINGNTIKKILTNVRILKIIQNLKKMILINF